jgi:hypothetical protein
MKTIMTKCMCVYVIVGTLSGLKCDKNDYDRMCVRLLAHSLVLKCDKNDYDRMCVYVCASVDSF